MKTDEQVEYAEKLREVLADVETIYTILRHVSKSGMTRWISLVVSPSGEPSWDISWLAAKALGESVNGQHEGIKIGGVGMDMGFALVYNLGRTLYPDGYTCRGEKCNSNDHVNPPRPRPDGKMHHRAGGYRFNHRWL